MGDQPRKVAEQLGEKVRERLGLDLPERRIGLSAHDFAQLLCADEVIVTHAEARSAASAASVG